MSALIKSLSHAHDSLVRLLGLLSPILDLGIRLWVAYAFFISGLTKTKSWDSTLALFEYEYEVPLLPPDVAAFMGTAAELSLPVLLVLGLAGRLSALGLFAFNIVAVVSYPFLWTEEGSVGFMQHVYWGVLLLVTALHGPGKLSLDYLLGRRLTANR